MHSFHFRYFHLFILYYLKHSFFQTILLNRENYYPFRVILKVYKKFEFLTFFYFLNSIANKIF